MKRKWFRRHWYWAVIAVIIITAGILTSVFSSYWLCEYILKFFKDWSVALSAGAAIILALAAFWSIRENRRIRYEDRKLNFSLRLLDEVRDWAREAVKLGFLYSRAERAKSTSETRQVIDMIEEIAKTTDTARIAAEVFENELEAPVNRALDFLKSYPDKTGKFASKEYFDSFHEVLKVVINLKKKLYYNK